MKPETEAKAIIGLIIALIAFGVGSGAGIVMALGQNDTSNTTHVTTNQESPQIPSTKNVNIQTQPQTTTNSNDTSSGSGYSGNGGGNSGSSSIGNSNSGNNQDTSSTSGNDSPKK